MKNVFFKPFVGNNYHNGIKGKKILVLGESHYCEGIRYENYSCKKTEKCLQHAKCQNFTNDVMARFFDYKKGNGEKETWMPTFTRFTNVFYGKRVNNEELLDFWNSVMFYNYVQKSVMEGSRTTPPEQDFVDSQKAFREILEEYKPDLIIVWGVRLWDRFPDIIDLKSLKTNPNEMFGYYKMNDKKIFVYAVYHPSVPSFTYDFHEYLQELLQLV